MRRRSGRTEMEREETRMYTEKYKTDDIEQSEQNTRLIFIKHNKNFALKERACKH